MKDKWDAILGLYAAAGKASLALCAILVVAAAVHAFVDSKGGSVEGLSRIKPLLISIGHALFAIGVYWHLITGGWFAESYSLNDPNLINLTLALFEVVAIGSVIAFWVRTLPVTYWFMVDLFVIQVVAALLILIWFLIILGRMF